MVSGHSTQRGATSERELIHVNLQSAVHQLVLHPAITSTLKVGSTTGEHQQLPVSRVLDGAHRLTRLLLSVGRDKLYRTIQYLARFLAFCKSSRLPICLEPNHGC